MSVLRVDLQDGFQEDIVVIQVNDGDELKKESVTTMPQVGYAGSIEMMVEPGPVRLRVSVPTRDLSDTTTVDVSEDLYVGVSIEDAGLAYRVSSEPMGYL
jgi:hypothetical protein